ncbi:hypothetical protein [Nocardia testacea]|uniref:hypothetical protein n=1 Tax=Nocardia testacea TaxID=248551 RepID=UPI003A83DAAC
MIQVVTRCTLSNSTFDIPEKLLSGHLLLISMILLAPHVTRLIDFFVRQRRCEPPRQSVLFADARKNRLALWLQVALGVWVVSGGGYDRWTVWQDQYSASSPQIRAVRNLGCA